MESGDVRRHEEIGDTQSSDVEEVTILEKTVEETSKLLYEDFVMLRAPLISPKT